MSWEAIIDQMKEWVIAQGYLTTGYIVRPNPVGWDFITINFIQDGGYHLMDLSTIVPANAKAVNLSTVATNPAVHMHIRASPYSILIQTGYTVIRTKVANVSEVSRVPVGIVEPQKIYYNVQPGGWTYIAMRILGWWL